MPRRSNSHETRWWRRPGLPLALLLLVAAPARSQHPRPSISSSDEHENGIIDGRVQALNGRSIPTTVTLKLVTVAGEVVSETAATTDGQFEFPSLPHIAYVLTVSAEGFETAQQVADLGRSGGKITLNIILQPAPKTPPPIMASETLTDGQAPKTARISAPEGGKGGAFLYRSPRKRVYFCTAGEAPRRRRRRKPDRDLLSRRVRW